MRPKGQQALSLYYSRLSCPKNKCFHITAFSCPRGLLHNQCVLDAEKNVLIGGTHAPDPSLIHYHSNLCAGLDRSKNTCDEESEME